MRKGLTEIKIHYSMKNRNKKLGHCGFFNPFFVTLVSLLPSGLTASQVFRGNLKHVKKIACALLYFQFIS